MKRIILSILIFLTCAAITANAQSTSDVKFNDKSELGVFNYYRDGKVTNIKNIVAKKFTAEFYTIGKAVKVFDDKTLLLLKKKNPFLAKQIGKITTFYQLKQKGQDFDFATFNSVNYDKFRNCVNKSQPCKIECDAVVITLEENGDTKNILVIKAIKKLK